jgi:CRISPR-associated endonuclease/helicase Cas3
MSLSPSLLNGIFQGARMLKRRSKEETRITPPHEKTIPTQFYAKTYQPDVAGRRLGRTVLDHCLIVGEIAKELMRRSQAITSFALFPQGAELVAAAHDIGKVSPTFQKKLLQATDTLQEGEHPFTIEVNPVLERNWDGHAGVTQVALEAAGASDFVPEIGGQHHGFSPSVSMYSAEADVFGGKPWQQAREILLKKLQKNFTTDWPTIESPEQARLVAGLTTVADWIGSGYIFDDPAVEWKNLIGKAIDMAGFVGPNYKCDQNFDEVFGQGFKPYPVQEHFLQLVNGPGVYVLEAPMGTGKTEAGLYAAYRLLCQQQASGIYFALPTQLTSNKIYERFNTFLHSILEQDCPHRKALLLHGKAWLQDTELGGEGQPGFPWFNLKKRGLLAPFGVGTLDQALMAAMNVRHGFVRAFGLAGKVVILDEVHTYDAYTGTIIDALVTLLKELHCTVIILSATLNQDRRQELVAATLQEKGFPLITSWHADGKLIEKKVPVLVSDHQSFSIKLTGAFEELVEEALKRAEQGQQVLWIENTVAEAQESYLDMASRSAQLGVSCGLLHSRFTANHRQRIEDHWVSLYGKEGWTRRGEQGRILVGTQVLEQSLDIDADFLVSRFCPSDMLLQRIGRLWRHKGTPRQQQAQREVWVLAPDLEEAVENPVKCFGNTAWVYSPYVLCRSLEVWRNLRQMTIPADIRPIIEETYIEREEEGLMARWLYELKNGSRDRKGREALRQLARITLARGGKTLPEAKAQTRYNEGDTTEVLLLKSVNLDADKRVTHITLLDGAHLQLPWDKINLEKKAWRDLSVTLTGEMVCVRSHHAPLPPPMNTLKRLALQNCFYLGRPEWDEPLLRLALVDEAEVVHGYQGAPLNEKYTIQYNDDLGYRTKKKEQERTWKTDLT